MLSSVYSGKNTTMETFKIQLMWVYCAELCIVQWYNLHNCPFSGWTSIPMQIWRRPLYPCTWGVPTGEVVTEGKDVITEIESSDTLDSCDREDTKHDMIMTINIYQAKWSQVVCPTTNNSPGLGCGKGGSEMKNGGLVTQDSCYNLFKAFLSSPQIWWLVCAGREQLTWIIVVCLERRHQSVVMTAKENTMTIQSWYFINTASGRSRPEIGVVHFVKTGYLVPAASHTLAWSMLAITRWLEVSPQGAAGSIWSFHEETQKENVWCSWQKARRGPAYLWVI